MTDYKKDAPPEYASRLATIEHITPQSMGGTDEPFNILIACYRCNNLRGSIEFSVFCEFARVVIQQFPEAPTPILRNALIQFQLHLVSAAMHNKRLLREASRLSLLRLRAETDEFNSKRKKK